MSSQGSKTPSRQQTPQGSVGNRIKGWFSGFQCPLKSCPLRNCKCCGFVQQHKLGVILGVVGFIAYIVLCAFLDCKENCPLENSTTTTTTTDATEQQEIPEETQTPEPTPEPTPEATPEPTPEPTLEPTPEPAVESETPEKGDL